MPKMDIIDLLLDFVAWLDEVDPADFAAAEDAADAAADPGRKGARQ